MFTGIIETKAEIKSQHEAGGITSLDIEKPSDWQLKIGQSIAVDGVCLTVVSFDEYSFTVELMEETLEKTTFGKTVPKLVNLERAMLPTDRFEGHIVQGHVDTVAGVAAVRGADGSHLLDIIYDIKHSNLVVPKGSITINGVSLTVVDTGEGTFSVALIPHTLKVTTIGSLAKGDTVNLEFDIIGKYLMNKK